MDSIKKTSVVEDYLASLAPFGTTIQEDARPEGSLGRTLARSGVFGAGAAGAGITGGALARLLARKLAPGMDPTKLAQLTFGAGALSGGLTGAGVETAFKRNYLDK